MSRRNAIAIAVLIGIAAGIAGAILPHAIRLNGVELGDIGLPIAGIYRFQDGHSPYGARLRGVSSPQYPFTTMVLLWPLSILPLKLIVPAFLGISSGLLAYGLVRQFEVWRLLLFLSPSFWQALVSVQWSPLVTASLLVPFLLPIALFAKPQLAILPLACGRWSLRTLAGAAAIALISIIIWPAWPFEWLSNGEIGRYTGFSPLFTLPGVLLIAATLRWRTFSGRLLLAMSLPLQRYFYDQLPLFLAPRTWKQMVALLLTSWTTIGISMWQGWFQWNAGIQARAGFVATVIGFYLPCLVIVLMERNRNQANESAPS